MPRAETVSTLAQYTTYHHEGTKASNILHLSNADNACRRDGWILTGTCHATRRNGLCVSTTMVQYTICRYDALVPSL